MTADRWMSYAEIAERLRVRLEETVELLAENEPPLPPRLEPDINYVAAANRTTIALGYRRPAARRLYLRGARKGLFR